MVKPCSRKADACIAIFARIQVYPWFLGQEVRPVASHGAVAGAELPRIGVLALPRGERGRIGLAEGLPVELAHEDRGRICAGELLRGKLDTTGHDWPHFLVGGDRFRLACARVSLVLHLDLVPGTGEVGDEGLHAGGQPELADAGAVLAGVRADGLAVGGDTHFLPLSFGFPQVYACIRLCVHTGIEPVYGWLARTPSARHSLRYFRYYMRAYARLDPRTSLAVCAHYC